MYFLVHVVLPKKSKYNTRSISVQIACVEGQINDLRPVDHGLYLSTKVGSLRLPTSGVDLRSFGKTS